MVKTKISEFIDRIKAIEGVLACALVSRDGIVAGKFFDQDINEPWFGALSATILASAESVGRIIRITPMESVTIRGQDMSVIVMGTGPDFLVTAIVMDTTAADKIYTKMQAVAQRIGEVM